MFVGSLLGGIAVLGGCAEEVDTSSLENKGSWLTSSPDGKIKAEVVMDYAGELSYTVKRNNVTVIEKSALGIDIARTTCAFSPLKMLKRRGLRVRTTISPVSTKR